MPFSRSLAGTWSPSLPKPAYLAVWVSALLTLGTCTGCSPSTRLDRRSSRVTNETAETSDSPPRISKETAASPQPDSTPGPQAKATSSEAILERCPAIEQAGASIKRTDEGFISEVDFADLEVKDTWVEALSPLKQLTRLTVRKSNLSNAGWQLIGRLSQLRQLDLRECNIHNEQLALALANLPRLAALRLNGKSGATQVDDSGLSSLQKCPHLKVLAIDYLPISAASLGYLPPDRLIELYMAGTAIDDKAVSQLSEFTALKKLRLANTAISDVTLRSFKDLPLEELDVSECSQITDIGLEPISEILSLKKLNLFKTDVSDAGTECLTSLKRLEWLNLDQTQITDVSLKSVAPLNSLKFLHLGSTAVSDAGMPELVTLSNLSRLIVTRTQVTSSGVTTVQTWLPTVDIQLEYVPGQ